MNRKLLFLALFAAAPAVAQTCDDETALSGFGRSVSAAAAALPYTCADGSGALETLSFGGLAANRVPPLLEKVIDQLAALDEDTPPHEPKIKELRKSIQKLRDHVDLFADAYPDEEWKALREDLDTGYETIGHFKDLFDSQGQDLATEDANGHWSEGVKPDDVVYPDAKEVKKRRKASLAWAEKFSKAKRLADYRAMVACPSESPEYDHKKSDLSKFFWAGTDAKPDADLTGLGNLRQLSTALLDEAAKEYDAAKKLKTPRGTNHEEQFHDFRKRMRSIGNVLSNFPEIAGADTKDSRALMTDAVSRYGAIEDQLVAWHLAQDAGKPKKAKNIAANIDEMWSDLLAWQKEQHLGRAIDELNESLAGTS